MRIMEMRDNFDREDSPDLLKLFVLLASCSWQQITLQLVSWVEVKVLLRGSNDFDIVSQSICNSMRSDLSEVG
jgi:hypothetical protein